MDAPQPSARLVRAVAAERAELERHRARLASEADELRAALARIEHGLAEIDQRRGLLDRLAPDAPDLRAVRDDGARRGARDGSADGDGDAGRGGEALRGPDIREVAVKLLVENGRDAMHYREWYELLERAGHEIAGKDPVAVFLTQISRSPAVRRGTRAGIYELDRGALPPPPSSARRPPGRAQHAPADRDPRRRRHPHPPQPPEHRDRPRRARDRGGRAGPRPVGTARRHGLTLRRRRAEWPAAERPHGERARGGARGAGCGAVAWARVAERRGGAREGARREAARWRGRLERPRWRAHGGAGRVAGRARLRLSDHWARMAPDSIDVRPAEPRDAEAVAAIYNHGIAERQATFETRPRRANEILGWLEEGRPFIVAAGEEGTILGFARVSAYSTRRAYAGVGEHAVYVAPRRGAGASASSCSRRLRTRRRTRATTS